jgi:ABC-type amino acid transport system permease subunit
LEICFWKNNFGKNAIFLSFCVFCFDFIKIVYTRCIILEYSITLRYLFQSKLCTIFTNMLRNFQLIVILFFWFHQVFDCIWISRPYHKTLPKDLYYLYTTPKHSMLISMMIIFFFILFILIKF